MFSDEYYDEVAEGTITAGGECPHCRRGHLYTEDFEGIERKPDGAIERVTYWGCDVCGTSWEVREVFERAHIKACVL